MAKGKIVSPTIKAVVGIAAGFSDEVYSRIGELISKPSSTDPSDDEVDQLCRELDISPQELRYFLSFLSFLFVQTDEIEEGEIRSSLSEFLSEYSRDADERKRLVDMLVSLLNHRNVKIAHDKQWRLVQGFLPNLVSISSFVDVRSNFDRNPDRSLKGTISGKEFIIQLQIVTNSNKEMERDFVLQLAEDDLESFQEVIDDIRQKLLILKEQEVNVPA